MSLVRPELLAAARRWREALIGAAVMGLGLWWVLAGGLLTLIGAAVLAGGTALAVSGLQRGRFHRRGDGPGVVELVEGELAYFGPRDGGTLALADVVEVAIEDGTWQLAARGGARLSIPADAAGAERLFDALAHLPGLDTMALVRASAAAGAGRRVIWRKAPDRLH